MIFRIAWPLIGAALFTPFCVPGRAIAQDTSSDTPVKKLILPGESFLVAGRPAFILWPSEEKRRQPQPWVMYAPTLPGLPDRHEQWMHQQFIDRGVAVAGIDVGEAYGSPAGQQHFTTLYRELTQQRGFALAPCLLGRSRGGLWTSSWAIANPDRVAGIAGIYPVFDLRTYPGIDRAAPAYGLTPRQLQERLDDFNPITQIDALAKARVPVFIIHGDDDKVVPLKENSAALLRRYVKAGAADNVELIVPRGQGHNFWPGFFRCQQLVDFAVACAWHGAGIEAESANRKPVPPGTVCFRELEYARPDSRPLRLDLYRPRRYESPVPVVVWVHGGGWKNGSKNKCPATWLCLLYTSDAADD